jgi:peptidoglycan hydrolase-like protein with peptidoglycan-binding domain
MTERRSRLLLAISLLLTLAVAGNAILVQGGGRDRVSAAAIAGDNPWPAGASLAARAGGEGATGTGSGVSPLDLARLDNQLVVESRRRDLQLVRAIQRELAVRGYAPGPVDGLAGIVTRAAIMAFERDNGLPLTGEPTDALLQSIVLGLSLDGDAEDEGPAEGESAAGRITLAVRAALGRLGYAAGKPGGERDSGLSHAIERFEADSGLKATGHISGPLAVALLRRIALEGPLPGAARAPG